MPKKRTNVCQCCLKTLPVEQLLHCDCCGNCYCEDCAARLGLCECAGELTYFD